MRILFGAALLTTLGGCAASSQRMFHNGDAKVTLYAPTGPRVWESDGRVRSEEGSDGWYFKDKSTGRLVIVSGNIAIEVK